MRALLLAAAAALLLGCTGDDASSPSDAGGAADATTSDAPSGSDGAASDATDASGPVIGLTSATVYAGNLANVTATGGDVTWSFDSVPSGSAITVASLLTNTSTASFVPDVVGDYVLRATPASAASAATTTVHALAAPVFFARTTMNGNGGIMDVHVAGHDGSNSHGAACTTTFATNQADNAKFRTMLTGASGVDWWEAPAGQASRFVFAGVTSLNADPDGGYAVSLVAGTDQSTCNDAPQTLRALEGPLGALGQPRISLDGTRVAFLEPLGSSFQVSTIGLDGTGYRVIGPIYAAGGPPDGSADVSSNVRVEWTLPPGTLVWPAPNADGTWSVMSALDSNVATTGAVVTCPGAAPHHVVQAATGAFIAAFAPTAGAPTDLFAIDPSATDCSKRKNLTSLTGATSRAHDYALAPLGNELAFLLFDGSDGGADSNDEGDLYVVPVDGSSAPVRVPTPTTGRIGPRWIAGGTRLAFTRAAPPKPDPDGGDPRYAETVSVVDLDGGAPLDLATGNGADTIVAGVGPGGSCAIARGASSSRAPASLVAIALAALVTRRRRSRSAACARPGARPSTRAARPTRANDSSAPPRS